MEAPPSMDANAVWSLLLAERARHVAKLEARDQARTSDQELIARLSRIIRDLQRATFGARSEKLDPDQLALALEDLEQELAAAEVRLATPAEKAAKAAKRRAKKTPIAAEALARIQELYRVEDFLRGRSPDERRTGRKEKSAPILEALKPWLVERLDLLSKKSDLAKAIIYTFNHWDGLNRFLDDGRIEIDSNTVERAIRPLAIGRKNHLFAGSEGGAEHCAVLASLIATCNLHNVEPQAYIGEVLTKLVNGHLQSRLDELLPWAHAPEPVAAVA